MDDLSVFLMGSARSGSKIYLNILEKHSDIAIAPEIKFWFPWPWEKCVVNLIEDNNFLKNKSAIERFVEQLWNGEVDSTFWHLIRGGEINLKKNEIMEKIYRSDRSYKSIFKIFIDSYRDFKGKKISGAQYPMHPYYYPTIMNWFPEGKFLQLCREPRPSLASHLHKEHFQRIIRQKLKNGMPEKLYEIFLLVYGIFNYNLAAYQYKKNKNDLMFLCKFEEFIINPKKSIKNLCKFLKIRYTEDMLNPPIKDSSFNMEKKRGFDKKTLIRWRKHLSKFKEKIILYSTKKFADFYGY
jgi:hypothetical protein